MKTLKMLILLATLPVLALAQTKEQALQNVKDRKGWYIGPGIYYADLTTQWKYNQTPPATGVPFFDASQGFGHDESRTLITIGIERKSIFGTPALRDGIFVNHYDYSGNYRGTEYAPSFNFVDFDLGADVLIGPSGKTYAHWLDTDEPISSGGLTAGASAYIRMSWQLILSPKLRLTPFSVAIGGQYLHIKNNGNGSAQSPLLKDFNYDQGWNENLSTLYLSVGILGIETGSLSITPEVRILTLSAASTSLKPARIIGGVQSESNPTFITFGVKVLKKF
ncbi:hypothetical protein IDJ77_04190 [Mucilaginibacter sp. ZT4R22]|uniref:Outer membrane protein with beta-barrel domain n=1 Tax=Mucilaginibacter pankratovii TaxID=2772110 RepID=A0ABR7WNX1_9SPHI|nr:hypothetical protein [Mucilaginibacter pankratovii]MBD1363002.1 hypothetical protein [Mucilaginibacter pankratovii]